MVIIYISEKSIRNLYKIYEIFTCTDRDKRTRSNKTYKYFNNRCLIKFTIF